MSNPFKKDDNVAEEKSNTDMENTVEDSNNSEEIKVELSDDLQAKYDELNNHYIRLAADFDNYRKRQAQERESLLKYGAESTLKKLLEVLDNFERGAKANESIDDCDKVKESFDLMHKQLLDVMTKSGLEVIETEGKEFDPNFHEAVMQTPTSEYPEHTIIAELQKGYKMGDRILRPALVNVATAE